MDHGNRPLILSRPVVIAALAIAFALVLSTALLSAFAVRGLARTDELGSRAKLALAAMTQLLGSIGETENELHRRDLRANDDPVALKSVVHLREDLAALNAHYRDRPDVRPLLRQLDGLARESTGVPAAPQLVVGVADSNQAQVLTAARFAEMRRLVYALQRQEFAALVEFSGAAAARAQRVQWLNAGLITAALALAMTGAWLLLRRMRDLEGLITVCAWTRRVEWQGRWISFEEYLARRFNIRCTHGISDEAAERMRDEIARTKIPEKLRRE